MVAKETENELKLVYSIFLRAFEFLTSFKFLFLMLKNWNGSNLLMYNYVNCKCKWTHFQYNLRD